METMTTDHGSCRCARARAEGAQKTGRSLRLTLPVTTEAARLARQATCIALAAWQLAYLEETAELLVSELVTNVIKHARGDAGTMALELGLETAGTWLRIEIQDGDPRRPQPRTPTGFDESGFGFILVEALAARWGVRTMAPGKAVWAELDTRREPGGVRLK
jgi:anti-sigma regulatory factor (Ser/Thr protein kinase)